MAVSERVAYGPSGAPLQVPRLSWGGGGGGNPLARRGKVKGRRPVGPPSACPGLRGGERG